MAKRFLPGCGSTSAAAVSLLLICSTAPSAYADKGGVPNSHAADTSAAAAAHGQGAAMAAAHAHGGQGMVVGVTPVSSGSTTYLQFTNAGSQAGTATVAIYSASSGAQLATW